MQLLSAILAVFGIFMPVVIAASKYNHRLYVDIDSISFADPLKHGFNVVLSDEFVKHYLKSMSLPTVFVTAIPLRYNKPDSMVERASYDREMASIPNVDMQKGRFTQILYPEPVNAETLVKINGLRERSWYYVCVEWENFNRHNETTGTTCKLFRTLDRFGKAAEGPVSSVEVSDMSDTRLEFKVLVSSDFPLRLTSYLKGGPENAPSQTYIVQPGKSSSPKSLTVLFPFLRPDSEYGQLCIVEEPLVNSYTAMGRPVQIDRQERCFFSALKTKPAGPQYFVGTEPEARAYRRNSGNIITSTTHTFILAAFITLLFNVSRLL